MKSRTSERSRSNAVRPVTKTGPLASGPLEATQEAPTAAQDVTPSESLDSAASTNGAESTLPASAVGPDSPAAAASAVSKSAKLAYVKAPPALGLPEVPSVVTIAAPRDVRVQLPKKEELAILPDAQAEIRRFADYVGVFGKTAPSQAVVDQTLDAAYEWTMLRTQLAAWWKYAKAQELAAWIAARGVTGRLRPAFELAVSEDPAIGEQNQSLKSLLDVRSAIARRGAATRLANEKSTAGGGQAYAEAPARSGSGRTRRRPSRHSRRPGRARRLPRSR